MKEVAGELLLISEEGEEGASLFYSSGHPAQAIYVWLLDAPRHSFARPTKQYCCPGPVEIAPASLLSLLYLE